jgi:vanillate O-demethylase monooxygenase subunit
MLERQQKNLLANPDRKLKVLSIDAGGVMSRRVLDRLLAAETGV